MKVSLAPSSTFEPVKQPGTALPGEPILDVRGPRTILGWSADEFAVAIQPSPQSLFGPRGVCLHPNGSLWVSDTGHHRLLGWKETPTDDNAQADVLIGQKDFGSEGRNGKQPPSAHSVNVPTGINTFRDGLVVADAWNHRILIWNQVPGYSNQPADIVLGQSNFQDNLANKGIDRPAADTLHWPYGVAEISGKLIVCDTGNRRILIWNDVRESGQAADLVLGQSDFNTRDENAGASVSSMSMRWPHQICKWGDYLAVADAGNNRIMLWEGIPTEIGAACTSVLGQTNFADCDHNLGDYYPSNKAVNMPYALACHDEKLIVGDTANSRVLSWEGADIGDAATGLTGQPDFSAKGDNRWGVAERDSLCWPYGLSVREGSVAIADSGNNRILIWDISQ